MKNIKYKSGKISEFYSRNRFSWNDLYPSERRIIEQIGLNQDDRILDLGCGCGGLAAALSERFGSISYTGVEINKEASDLGKTLVPTATIICGDIIETSETELDGLTFRVVFSLSCVDWNLQFQEMLHAAWKHVEEGGYLVSTFRICNGKGVNDLSQSYQFINFDGVMEGEKAPYVVFEINDLLETLTALVPEKISGFGYWGSPSASAVTPYDQLCFAAFAIKKGGFIQDRPVLDLDLPQDVMGTIG